MTVHSGIKMPSPPSKPYPEKQGSSRATQRPRAQSESDVENMAKRRVSTSKNYQPKVSIFKSLETTPRRFTGALCPTNLLEQKERFLRFGITPQFVMKASAETLEKLTNKDRGQIRFAYLNEAKLIIEAVKRKYGDGSAYIQEMFGEKIDQEFATEVLTRYLKENGVDGEMAVYWAPDLACTAKMMWHGPCQRYNKPEARKYTLIMKNSSENNFLRDVGIVCLANHEVGTHYFRMVNDGLQPWFSDRNKFQLKGMSTRDFTSTEEGLATINTVIQAKSKYLWTSAILYYTACMAAEMTFRELFDHLALYMADKEQRWKHVMRVKRGLRDPSEQGGYGNDQCYFEGAVEILRSIDSIDFNLLYSGRMCVNELKRVRRLARLECIKLPRFLKDIEKYKRTLRQIAVVNGLIPKPERTRNMAKKPPTGARRARNFTRRYEPKPPLVGANTSSSKIKLLHTMPFSRGAVSRSKSRSGSDSRTSVSSSTSPGPLPEIVPRDEPRSPVFLTACDGLDPTADSNSQLSRLTAHENALARPKSLPNKILVKRKDSKEGSPEKSLGYESFGLLER